LGRVTLIGYAAIDQLCLGRCGGGPILDQSDAFGLKRVESVTNLDSLGHHYVTRFPLSRWVLRPGGEAVSWFCGAEQVDVGDASAPTLVTHSYFDTRNTAFHHLRNWLPVSK